MLELEKKKSKMKLELKIEKRPGKDMYPSCCCCKKEYKVEETKLISY
jgi:hypothetical protein